MSKILEQLKDEQLDFTVKIKDTDGVIGKYEFLDIVFLEKTEYLVLEPLDDEGYLNFFKVIYSDQDEAYEIVNDEDLQETLFEIFKLKNEDEFDFD
ncbi:MAG: hypothetical protein R3Y27_09000 [Clostridia bacterium]